MSLCVSESTKTFFLFAEENLALQRPTTQSDILWSYGPDLAVDGDPNTCSFTTRQEGQRWWQVSAEWVKVSYITLYQCDAESQSNFTQHFLASQLFVKTL